MRFLGLRSFLLWAGGLLLLSVGLSFSVFAAPPSSFRNFSPNPISRPHQPAIRVDARWDEFIRFLPNRGPTGVSYLNEVLKLLDQKRISKIEGFKSAKRTRITLSSLEFRSAEVVTALEKLLKAGYQVRAVVDGSFAHTIDMPTPEVWGSWSTRQRQYFVSSYDQDEDGRVSSAELTQENRFRLLSAKTWIRMQNLAAEYKGQLELIESPREIVPERDEFNYPRLHHTKALTIQFRRGRVWGGPIIDLKSSANFTDTCLDRRIEQTDENMENYVGGGEAERKVQSQGHVQFGAVFGEKHQDPEALAAITEHLEEWYLAYKGGQPFDVIDPAKVRDPALVFKDGSTLEVFYSEGQRLDGKKTIDPIWAITETLNRKDLKLTAYFDTQFVFTHTAFAKHLRSVLSRNQPKEFFLAVDGSQAAEPWSALPQVLFARIIRESPGVLPGKAIEDTPEIDPALDWENNVFVYRGGLDWHGRENDKLHLKLRYFEYINAEGEKNYVVMWGSANTSHNASKLNADVSYIFKTKDVKLAKMIRPFFKSLREDSRMMPYRIAYLSRVFLADFNPIQELNTKKYLDRFAKFLSGGKRRDSFDSILEVLREAGAATPKGKLMLKWLEWNAKYREPLAEFGWDDFWIVTRITEPGRALSADFFSDLRLKWTEKVKTVKGRKSAVAAFNRVIRGTTESLDMLTDEGTATTLDLAKARLRDSCTSFLNLVRKGGKPKRVRYPVAGKRYP